MRRESNEYPQTQPFYFLTFNTLDWVDIFVRPVYKQIVVHSLNHFIEHKGLEVYAWSLMTNHLHLLCQARKGASMGELEKEFKAFTTQKILEAIDTEPASRREWMLERFARPVENSDSTTLYRIWQLESTPVIIDQSNTDVLAEHFEYIHANPVRDRIVDAACDYLYSSARDYAGMQGLVHISSLPVVDQEIIVSETTSIFFGKFLRS